MLFFTIRRIISSVFVLLASSFLVFALCAASFDPLAKFRTRQPAPTQAYLDHQAHLLGIDRPFFARYWDWLSGVVTGDFGKTINGTPVADQLWVRAGVTSRMIIAAMLLAIVLAVIIGVIGAVRQYKPSDYFFTFISYMLIALLTFAAWSRFQRASMLDVLGSDYMRLARAKGLTYRRTVFRHGLRNALIPLTTVVALGIGTLFGSAVITETVFNWNGKGRYLLDNGIGNNDINVVLGWLLLSAVIIVLFNLIADILYAVLDPRIRLA
jgi:peptide/nickel transport system permease protein